MGILFLVATPIGNLEDMTFRAVRTLQEVAVIAAEDTRTARKLLTRYDIHTPLISFHEYSQPGRLEALLERLAAEDVAVISEAGMPAISDPGYRLVVAAIGRGIRVVPIPGPSALVAALAASGLPTDSFVFLGFLPARAGPRRQTLESIVTETRTLVFYESPHRLLETVKDMLAVLGDRQMTIGREITKLHEEFWRGTIAEAGQEFGARGPRGEFTLVVAGAPAAAPTRWSAGLVKAELARRRSEGLPLRVAAREVATRSGWGRREVYDLGAAGADEPDEG